MSLKKFTIEDKSEIEEIIAKAYVCYVSMVDLQGMPYVVPMNYGFKNNTFYLHSAPEGKKINIWKQNPSVCIALDVDGKLNIRNEEVACSYSMRFRSVMAYGKIEFVEDMQEKRDCLNIIMEQYTKRNDFKYNDPAVRNVAIMKVKCDKIIGHNRGYMCPPEKHKK